MTRPFLLLSIQRVHADRIFSGAKTFELRKALPRKAFGTVFLYETGARRIIGAFEPGEPIRQPIDQLWATVGEDATPHDRFLKYFSKSTSGCAIPVGSSLRFTPPLDTGEFSESMKFRAPLSWTLVNPDTALFAILKKKLSRMSRRPQVCLRPIAQKDRPLYISSITSEIAPKYDEISEDFARAVLKTHRLGRDPNGIFTRKKKVLSIFLPSGSHVGFTTLTYKIGKCVKTGPTVLFPRYRGKGLGLATRRAIEQFALEDGQRKLYCTCPDSDGNIFHHLIRAGFSIEAHLKFHYSSLHGEIVLGKTLGKTERVRPLRIGRPSNSALPQTLNPEKARARTFLRKALRTFWGINSRSLASTIVLNAQVNKSRYEHKPIRLLFFGNNRSVTAAAMLVPKRGGALKAVLFPYCSASRIGSLIRRLEVAAKESRRRKLYFVHPIDDFDVLLELKRRRYHVEGVLKEPYGAGRDAIVASRILVVSAVTQNQPRGVE